MFHIHEVENFIHQIQSAAKDESRFTRLKKKIRLKRIKAIRASKGSSPKASEGTLPRAPFDYFS